ncbi:MAG TPA: hypothetical protein VHG08_28585 [Longimicrobium sp.]|nr:hypothetical protein [Longimicrobium sp.]
MRPIDALRPLCATAALALAATPAAAQDLGLVEGLFEEVSAVTVFYQWGRVAGSDDVRSDGLRGAGTEVLIELASTPTTDFELGLGASYLRGYQAVEPTLDLRTAVRALPTISLYVSHDLTRRFSVYGGGSFGLLELWHAQAYDAADRIWDLEARTFEFGLSGGVFVDLGPLPGIFAEAAWRSREFSSVQWDGPDEAIPTGWPRSLDMSGYSLSLGLQVRLPEDGEGADDAITPPAPAGTWMLVRADGSALPALLDSSQERQRDVVHGVLRLRPAEGAGEGGAWELELNLRDRAGPVRTGQPEVRMVPHREAGWYVIEDDLMLLSAEQGPAHRAERLAGRLYLQWNGHVLAFAPGNAPPDDE